MRLIYISGARLPSEMAHGIQIMQNCEAFAAAGADVRLWYARRGVSGDVHDYYGVNKTFPARKLPCLNIHGWVEGRVPSVVELLAFYVFMFTFGLAAGIGAWFARPDVIYGRDPIALLAAGWLNPRRKVVWEAHSLKTSGKGTWLQRQTARRADLIVAITGPLRDDLLKLRPDAKIIVAHDGIRAERFENLPDKAAARTEAGWPQDKFIVGYAGRLTTYNMTKGIDTLIHAIAGLPDAAEIALALVGGPDAVAEEYRALWVSLNLPDANFLYTGQVPAARVPRILSAFDICAMPHPRQEHFIYYTSPLKLFEYMAAGRALVASDLPSWADVLRDGENALLVPAGDAAALGKAIARLKQDHSLRERLAAEAKRDVFTHYTWDRRARAILEAAE
jgi:glycosyltransferase involved in cell wall biosynthesis